MFGSRAQISSAMLALELISFLQIHAVSAAPIGRVDELCQKGDQNETPVSRKLKRSVDITVIVTSTCSGHGIHEFLISRERSGCFNIENSSLEQIITTEPEGIKMRIFDQPYCEGKWEFYNSHGESGRPTSYKESSHLKLPFQVSSFKIEDE